MTLEPCIDGKSKIEIDESKFITYDNSVRWLFGLVDRGNYDIRIFYVSNDRTKESLMPYIQHNVYTSQNRVYNNADFENEDLATRIYSDSFSSYQIRDFNEKGYKLHRINHSLWFLRVISILTLIL